MSKKIIAALMALTMCAGLAACGNTAEESSAEDKAASSAAAEESKAEESKAEDTATDEETTAENEGSTEIPEDNPWNSPGVVNGNTFEDDYIKMRLVDDVICIDQKDLSCEPTEDELKELAYAARDHYNAAVGGDINAFLDTVNFDLTIEPFLSMVNQVYEHTNAGDLDEWVKDSKLSEKFDTLDAVSGLSESLGSAETVEAVQAVDFDNGADGSKEIQALFDSINADEPNTQKNLSEKTIWDADGETLTLSDKATYAVYPVYFGRDGEDVYTRFNMMILDGEDEHDIVDVIGWKVDGKWGICATDYYKTENYEDFKGKNAKEIFDYESTNMYADE